MLEIFLWIFIPLACLVVISFLLDRSLPKDVRLKSKSELLKHRRPMLNKDIAVSGCFANPSGIYIPDWYTTTLKEISKDTNCKNCGGPFTNDYNCEYCGTIRI